MKEMSTIRFAIWNMPKVAGQEFIFAKSEASKESSNSVDRFFLTLMVYESVPDGSWTGTHRPRYGTGCFMLMNTGEAPVASFEY